MLSLGGWLSWQAIRGLMPAAPAWLGYALAVLGGVGLIWGHGYMHGADGKSAAVERCNLAWTTQIDEKNDELTEARARAKAAADAEPATPADAAERLRLCGKSPTCRDHR